MKKFTRKDKKIIQNFVNNINSNLTIKISENKRFECDIQKNRIYLGLKTIDQEELELFEKWFKQQPEYIEINRKIISILHEIGHFQTFNQEQWEFRNKQEDMLVFLYEQDIINYEELNFSYWNIENERLATMWGIEYYKNHKEECEELAAAVGL